MKLITLLEGVTQSLIILSMDIVLCMENVDVHIQILAYATQEAVNQILYLDYLAANCFLHAGLLSFYFFVLIVSA